MSGADQAEDTRREDTNGEQRQKEGEDGRSVPFNLERGELGPLLEGEGNIEEEGEEPGELEDLKVPTGAELIQEDQEWDMGVLLSEEIWAVGLRKGEATEGDLDR